MDILSLLTAQPQSRGTVISAGMGGAAAGGQRGAGFDPASEFGAILAALRQGTIGQPEAALAGGRAGVRAEAPPMDAAPGFVAPETSAPEALLDMTARLLAQAAGPDGAAWLEDLAADDPELARALKALRAAIEEQGIDAQAIGSGAALLAAALPPNVSDLLPAAPSEGLAPLLRMVAEAGLPALAGVAAAAVPEDAGEGIPPALRAALAALSRASAAQTQVPAAGLPAAAQVTADAGLGAALAEPVAKDAALPTARAAEPTAPVAARTAPPPAAAPADSHILPRPDAAALPAGTTERRAAEVPPPAVRAEPSSPQPRPSAQSTQPTAVPPEFEPAPVAQGTRPEDRILLRDARPVPANATEATARSVVNQALPAIIAAPERGRIEVRLDPPALGRLEIAMDMADGQLRVVVQADRPATLDLLRRHGDMLTQQLQESGFADVDLSFSSESGPRGRERPGLPVILERGALPDEPAPLPTTAPALRLGGDRGLDLRL